MKPWDLYTWTFPDAGAHPAVIVGTDEPLRLRNKVNVLLCSSHRSPQEIMKEIAALDAESAEVLENIRRFLSGPKERC